jgi:hypothetical protein
VDDIRLQASDQVQEVRPYQEIAGMGLAVDRDASNAKLETGRDLGQRCLRACAAGQTVGDNSDMVAAIGLSIGEVQDVSKDPTDRRAHRVQDTKRLV